MAAKKREEVRISKRTGKPVRSYTKPSEKPAARKPRRTSANAPRGRATDKGTQRRATQAYERNKPAAKPAGKKSRRDARSADEVFADMAAVAKRDSDARNTKEGADLRARLEAAGLMLPGVVGIVLADASEARQARSRIEAERIAAEKAAAQAAREAAEAEAKRISDDAKAAAEAAAKAAPTPETAPTEPPPATPRTAGDEATALARSDRGGRGGRHGGHR